MNYISLLDCSAALEIKNILIKKSQSLLSTYYISPELTGRIEAVPDHRSDYYSFGVFLYELFCGRKPFSATSAANIMYQQLTQVPIEPVVITNTIGAGFSNVIMKLLNKSPAKRYFTSAGIKRDIELAFELMAESKFNTSFDLAKFDLPERFTLLDELIARDEALFQLDNYLHLLQTTGNSQFIIIEGEKGIGKTTVVNTFEKELLKKISFL